MVRPLKVAVEKFENLRVPLWVLFVEISIMGGLRYWIEGEAYEYTYDFIVFFHAIAYYIFIFSFVLFMTKLITGEKIGKIASAFSLFIPVILIPPIMDHYLLGRTEGYPYPTSSTWFTITFTFFGRYVHTPSPGYQLEFGILLILWSLYIFSKWKFNGFFKRAVLTLVTSIITYLLILILSTPDFSPVVNLIYIQGDFGVITGDFYYWVLIFRYFLLTSTFFFVIVMIYHRKSLLKFLNSPLLYGELIFMDLIYAIGFLIGASTMDISVIPGRINQVVLLLGILAIIYGWLFFKYLEEHRKNIMRQTPLKLSLFFSVMGLLIMIPFGILPLIIYSSYLISMWIYHNIADKRLIMRSTLFGLATSLIFTAGYTSPRFISYDGINANLIMYFLLIMAVTAIIVFIKEKNKK